MIARKEARIKGAAKVIRTSIAKASISQLEGKTLKRVANTPKKARANRKVCVLLLKPPQM